MNLRDTLLEALKSLPGTREFHIHVLVSSPRKHSSLFPYAHPRPRAYLQDIFILLSEQTNSDSPRVFVSAIEASVYNIPATSCGVLYVSKVDSTGHATAPSPTATLVRAFLTCYADPATRPIRVEHLWIQLFARAQGQYLFPNSSDFPGKRPLSDVKLCAWWKSVFSSVAKEAERRLEEQRRDSKLKLFYVLPGYTELEAINSLRTHARSTDALPSVQWTYGHPYSQTDIPLPCPPATDKDDDGSIHLNLGHFIPSFDDDPKSRFIDEIAYTTNIDGVRSPQRKRAKPLSRVASGPVLLSAIASHADDSDAEEDKEKDRESNNKDKTFVPIGELGKVTSEEFWERMSFRQECVAGALTGFFSFLLSTPHPTPSTESAAHPLPSPLAPQPGQVSPKIVRRVVATLMNQHEFSTADRSARATETLEGAIRGLCEDIPSSSSNTISNANTSSNSNSIPTTIATATATATASNATSTATRDVTPEPAEPRTPPRRPVGPPRVPDTPGPFEEPVASLDTYTSWIYGSVYVRNPPLVKAVLDKVPGAGAEQKSVTVLAVRKKRKVP